jgi:hypothetical protein
MGIEGWSEVLEFSIGKPVLVGYLAYIVGLLVAIAVVRATETAEPTQANEHRGQVTASRAMRSLILPRIWPMSKSFGCLYARRFGDEPRWAFDDDTRQAFSLRASRGALSDISKAGSHHCAILLDNEKIGAVETANADVAIKEQCAQ